MSENNVVSIFKHDKQANIVKVADSFEFKRGGKLPNITMAYETWGKLNSAKSNVVVVLTGLYSICCGIFFEMIATPL